MKTLVINSYAGSLTIGASDLGCDIIGSYEDHAFGIEIQKNNFPHLEFRDYRKDWPDRDLSEVFVIAHPPCSAFSVQNTSPTARGINSNAFACTKVVLEYAMKNNAVAIAIESVMGALGGAWQQHQKYADENDYHLYRILENGCMFGAQWRERFWAVWVKKGAVTDPTFNIRLTPRFQTVGDVVDEVAEEGPTTGNCDSLLEKQKLRLIEEAGCTPAEMARLFDRHPVYKQTQPEALGTVLWKEKFKAQGMSKWECFQKFIGGFASGTMCYIYPESYTPVLMGGSWWYYNGRNLSENGYKLLAGFPEDYDFETDRRGTTTQMRMYLSKGVMPPIAKWIAREITAHLGWQHAQQLRDCEHAAVNGKSYEIPLGPDRIADFRISRYDWGDEMPPIRHNEERSKYRPEPSPAFNCEISEDEPQPAPRVKPPKPPKPAREPRVVTGIGGRLDSIKVQFKSFDGLLNDLTSRRRKVMLSVIQELGTPSHLEAVNACIMHPDVDILPTTARWHIRQMVREGQLHEVSE